MATDRSLTILITGSSSGFGEQTARALTARGHRVFASMRHVGAANAAASRRLAEWAAGEKGQLHVLELDVTDAASVETAVGSLIEQTGRIDAVVNNAGTGAFGLNEAFTLDQVQALFDVNVFGALRVNRAVLPFMRRRRSGLLVHVSSFFGRLAFPFHGLYAATKFALEALAESFHYELRELGIESVLVEPAAYPTGYWERLRHPGDTERLTAYGPVAQRASAFATGVESWLQGAGAPDPREVAEAIAGLIDSPAGQRPLRTAVGLGAEGIRQLNAVTGAFQAKMMQAFGLAGAVEEE